ncbi:MAG: C40 family peptidase [Flavobacteriales bacterium]|nr:C40 family peptidase [Flavobacteriales bacterium]
MQAVICPLSLVPVRREPDDRAEMVTQWLFGETARLLDRLPKWVKIQFDHDGYEGWVDVKQALETESAVPATVRSIEPMEVVQTEQGLLRIPLGGVLPHYARRTFQWQGRTLPFEGRTSLGVLGSPAKCLLAMQDLFLGAPYLWGGRSPYGIDCSGLTQMLFALCGHSLPRDAWQQAERGEHVAFVDLATTGDLAFFDNPEGRIIHVGIVLADEALGRGVKRILHASGQVRIDHLDQHGIFNAGTGRYTHTLRMVRRVW